MNDETPNAQQFETERSLRENERRLATLLSNLPGMAYRCKNDKDWTMKFVSGGCEALTGYKAIDLIGVGATTYNSLIHPDDRDRVWNEVQEALGQNLPFRLTYRIRAADGREKWVWEQGVGIYSGAELEALEGFITDITELKEAERNYRNIFEGAIEGMYRATLQGRSLAANPALARILGYDSAQELVSTITDTTHQLWLDPNERSHLFELLNEQEIVRRFECQFKRKDGTPIWVSVNIRKVSGSDEQPGYCDGFIEDISERKRIEDALRTSEKKFAKAFQSSPVSTVLFKPDVTGYRIIDVNEAFEQDTGYRRDEVLGRMAGEFGIWADPNEFDAAVRQFRAHGRVRDFEAHHRTKTGDIRTVLVSVEWIDLGGTQYGITTAIDITERQRSEKELRLAHKAITEAEEQYRNIFDGALEGIYRTSPEGKLLAANSALAKMLGYESREQLVSTINDMAHQVWLDPNDRKPFIALLEEQGSLRNFECQVKRKDGTGIWVSVKGRKVCGADGRTLYYDGFVDDITERKHTEAEKAKLEEQLRQAQKIESIGRLAGGVAHDFNNLLTVINGYSDFLLERLNATDPLRSHAEEIRKAGERAASLTRQLLAFSRKQVIEPKIMDLNTTIRQSAPMLQRLIGEDIDLETYLDESLGQVLADPDQFYQVIMNLAVNARDAMPDGGTLDIETTNVELDEANTATMHDAVTPGRYVLMSVTDSGHGMDETIRQQIFEPFFTTKEVGKGTGLGLSMVYGIIRQSGGWIEVQSDVGVGTSFKVYLPRIEVSLAPERQISAATEKGSETILLVEDQEAVRSFTKTVLERHGYQVIDASDAEEAIDAAGTYSGEIHLLLTDVVLPGMNGKELSEMLKAFRPTLKVLFTSGYTADAIGNRGVLGPDVTFLHKPFSPEELAAKVRDVLITL
jgi:two-component system, cell cycle sensor histidine kinase and response regulator CckA